MATSASTVYLFQGEPSFSSLRIEKGDWVVIKPNLVKECNLSDNSEWLSVVTDSALIKKVCHYVCRQLNGVGRVTICDAPQTDSSFSRIAELLDLYKIASECSSQYSIPVEILDLRNEEWITREEVVTDRRKLAGDPSGVVRFNLGCDSLFYRHPGKVITMVPTMILA